MTDPGPQSAGINAGASVVGGAFDAIGQGRQNRRQGRQGAQSAENLNKFIQETLLNQDYSGLTGAEGGALRDALTRTADRTAMGVDQDVGSMRDAAGDMTWDIENVRDAAGGLDQDISNVREAARGMGQDMDSARSSASAMGRDIAGVRGAADRVTSAAGDIGRMAGDLRSQADQIQVSDTTGLESAARRQLEEQSGILDAQLAGRGAFSSGRGVREQRRLTGDVFSNLASEINADQFRRSQAAGQMTQGAGGLYGQQAGALQGAGGLRQAAGQLRGQQSGAFRDVGQLGAAQAGAFQGAGQLGATQGQLFQGAGQLGATQANIYQGAGQLGLGAGQLQADARQAAMDDQFRREAEALNDQFGRESAAGEIMTLPAFSFYDTENQQAANQGK